MVIYRFSPCKLGSFLIIHGDLPLFTRFSQCKLGFLHILHGDLPLFTVQTSRIQVCKSSCRFQQQITANNALKFSGIHQQITANHMQIKTIVFVVLGWLANHCKACDLQAANHDLQAANQGQIQCESYGNFQQISANQRLFFEELANQCKSMFVVFTLACKSLQIRGFAVICRLLLMICKLQISANQICGPSGGSNMVQKVTKNRFRLQHVFLSIQETF